MVGRQQAVAVQGIKSCLCFSVDDLDRKLSFITIMLPLIPIHSQRYRGQLALDFFRAEMTGPDQLFRDFIMFISQLSRIGHVAQLTAAALSV